MDNPPRHNSLEKCSDQKSVTMKLVQALLVQCLPYVPTKEIDETLLQHAMPAAKQIFIEVCLELLNWLDCAIQYIMSLGALDVLLVQSAPKNIADILFRSFKHCKDSEALYGDLFQTVSETLTVLFRKTHTLQSHYISALSENFQFNCMFEDELDMLTQVLVLLSTTGELVVGLDAKTMAEQWKGYIRLAERHAEHLRPRLDVASPIRLSRAGLQYRETDAQIAQVVETHAGIAEEPLLALLVSDASFSEKLLQSDLAVRKLWLDQDKNLNIIFQLFTLFGQCHGELSWPLQIPGVMLDGEPPRSVDLYETVLTHLAGFVMTVSAEQFSVIEAAMLENILQCNVWRAMLAMDLWCLVARYGSAELCFHHIIFLLRILEKFPPGGPRRPEAVFLSSLLGQLFPLLSDEHKAAVCKHFPPSQHPGLWGSLGVSCLPDALKSSVAEKLMQGVVRSLKSLVTDPPDIQLYNQLVKCLPAVPVITEVVLPTPGFISDMVNVWERINLPEVYTSQETSQQGTQWLHHLATLLCDATVPLVAHVDNSQLLKDLWVMLGKNIPLLYLVNNRLTLHTTILASKVSIPGNHLQVRHH
uniref:Uncharacterized protein n=1 Tax=Timema bartmani TaxID=61472 RepID=A0A7R9I082_9NEOP|nr:unnamed protein product [Timema bartmani]